MKRVTMLFVVVLSALCLIACAAESQAAVQKITPEEAHDMMTSDRVTVLDVRSADEFAAEHIPNAQSLPVDDITLESAQAVAPETDEPVLVYCRSGHRSAIAAEKLAELGYSAVYDFGGIMDWPYETISSSDDGDSTESAYETSGKLPMGAKAGCSTSEPGPIPDQP